MLGRSQRPAARCVAACLWAACALPAQPAKPQFQLTQGPFRPGGILEIYGRHLGPEPQCGQPLPWGPYVTEACGVRVTVGGISGILQFVSARLIRLFLPANLADGAAPVQVCVHHLCSEPVMARFASRAVVLQLQEPAYVHMPLWIAVDMPAPYRVVYPCRTDPWEFHGRGTGGLYDVDDYKIELRHKGTLLAEAPRPTIPVAAIDKSGCMSGFGFEDTPPFRLPLHLAYRIATPGDYEIRLTGSHGPDVLIQSAWTKIAIKPRPRAAHDAWLRAMAQKARSAGPRDPRPSALLSDVVPSLLAWPDEKALRILLPVYSYWLGRRRLLNGDIYVAGFLRNSLTAFGKLGEARFSPTNPPATPRTRPSHRAASHPTVQAP